MGAVSGSVTGSGESRDTECTDDGHGDGRKLAFDWSGLALTDDEFRLESMQYTPTVDGEKKRLFVVEGFEATVGNDIVTDMDVDSIDIHEDLGRVIVEFVDCLANGDVPHGFDTAPNEVYEYLDRSDTRYFEDLRTVMETDGVTDTFKRAVQNDGGSGGYAGGFVLILVLFILLVIIGAGFGLGTGHPSEI